MTDSFLEARGLKPQAAPQHSGPINARRLVEAYGCHVFPLALGSKVPTAETRGVLDAVSDASGITGNYGIACGLSGILAVDLDDYVPDNEIQGFIDTFELPPTFTIKTGSGGRSMWFRAPEGVELGQSLGQLAKGVDIKAGNSYILGPGNRLHPSNVKKDSGGDGEYSFIKGSPTTFAPAPARLIDALLERKANHVDIELDQSAFEEFDESTQRRVKAYVQKAMSENLSRLEGLKSLDEGERESDTMFGWETGTLAYTGAIAQLVKANWTGLDYDEVLELVKAAVPGSGDLLVHHVGLFVRAVSKAAAQYPPRVFPTELAEPEFDWFPKDARRQGFPEVDGSDEAPPAEPIHIDEDPNDWPEQPWNEEGNVQRGLRWSAGTLRWLKDEEIWVSYDQIRWVRDKTAGAYAVQQGMKAARHTELKNYSDVPQMGDDGQPKPGSSERDKFVAKMSDMSKATMFDQAARSLALSGQVTSLSTDFDCDPMMMGVQNGVVDLRTGELTPPAAELMISHVAAAKYDPEAKAPRFLQYLEESLPDPEVRAYLKRVVGYSITGLTIEQVMFIHQGKTSNGKSVLMDILGAMLGEYGGGADPKALIETKNEQHSTHVASLAGPRFLMMSETAKGARLSDTLIKNITGGDIVTARKLYKENQDLKIIGKINMVTNHLPHIVASPSTNRRIQLIHWPVEIAEEKIDLKLASKIIATELEGVLAWAVAGAVEWWATLEAAQGQPVRRGGRPSGLGMPQQVITDTANYLRSEDDILEWLEERTQESDTIESTGNLYQDYRSWAERRGVRNIMALRAFSTDLETRGEIKRGRSNKAKGFQIGLQPLQQNYFGI